jgi:prophage regulatory protein
MRREAEILLDVREVRYRVLFSLMHIGRLEVAGKFPERIQFGRRRIAWSLREVLQWMQTKVDAPRVGKRGPPIVVGIDDRFIGKKEVRSLVPYTVQHLRVLEHASEFPGRIRIGDNRSAWLEREVLDWIEDRRSRRRRK